ncbi:MAG: NERD domain-containing protein [Hylemonella sp.]|nr:NERD domain-containing protein [Hylemonella sp.]
MTVETIDPPLSELSRLRQPLTKGELLVLEFFRRNLNNHWEIYIQPHLNGLRPDFVLINPNTGIAVFEVKDWDLSAIRYFYKSRDGCAPELFGNDGTREFALRKSDPIGKIELYKGAIHNVFCPHLEQKAGFGLITGGIIFPFAESSAIERLLRPARDFYGHSEYPKWNTLIGSDDLVNPGGIKKAIRCAYLEEDMRMDEKHANDLRHWLVEPEFSREQRSPLMAELDDRQKEIVNSRNEKFHRRLRGPAGCGKSVILAARAAKLAGEGKRVLLVTFNITLINYLLDYAVRYSLSGKVRTQLEAWNFHYWCKVMAAKTGHWGDYGALWGAAEDTDEDANQDALNISLASETAKWLVDLEPEDKYDAIFVDEGQDFREDWWKALMCALTPGGEMLLCADKAQNIYGVSNAWTDDATRGTKLAKPIELKISYRMPGALCLLAAEFLDTFLPDPENIRPQQPDRGIGNERLKWAQMPYAAAVKGCLSAIEEIVSVSSPPVAISDLTLIVDDAEIGRRVINELFASRGIRCIDTLAPTGMSKRDQEALGRRKKLAFFKGDARVKVTTMHSFKGWESRALVVLISNASTRDGLSLAYAGITRLKETNFGSYLTVVCTDPHLENFGKKWPEFTGDIANACSI